MSRRSRYNPAANSQDVTPRITGFSPPLTSGVSTTSHPAVLGTAGPYSLITLYLNGTVVGTGFSDASGSWSIALPAQLNGTFSLVVRATPASSLTSLVINDPKQPLQNTAGVPAVFEMDNERGLFYTAGAVFSDLTSLVGAVSGVANGVALSLGGYVDSQSSNVLTNGTFDTATTGWTASGSGALAIVSGEMQFTINATSDSFSQTVTGYPGRAFAFTGTGRRGTNSINSPQLAATTQNSSLGGNLTSAAAVTAVATQARLHLASGTGAGMFLGVRGSTGTGTTLWDNFSLVEAMPLAGWNALATGSGSAATSFSVLVDAVAPATLPTSGQVKVIWQADTNTLTNGSTQASQRDSIRLHWASDGTVHLVVRLNNTQVLDFTLGTVATGARFRVTLAAAPGVNSDLNNGYAASLNGANSQILSTTATSMVGVSHMRLGQEANGASLWDGTYNRVAVVQGRQLNDWLEFYATLPSATPRVFAGDSYIGGAGGVVLPDLYETAAGQITYNIGVGGTTFQQQVGHITSRPYLRDLPLVIWDGSNNGMVDIASQVATAQQIYDWKANGRVLFVPSLAVPNPATASSSSPSANATYLRSYRDALITAFGTARVYDPVPLLQSLSTGSADDINDVAAGLIPRSTLLTQNSGEVHLSLAAMTAIAQHSVFQSKIAAL